MNTLQLNEKGQVNPIVYHEYVQALKVEDQLTNTTSIQKVAQANKPVLVKILVTILQKELKSMNFAQGLGSPEIHEIAMLVTEKFGAETIEDFMLAFHYFKLGRLSFKPAKLYRISFAEVMQILDAYNLEHKIPKREEMHRRAHLDEDKKRSMSFEDTAAMARKWLEDKAREKSKARMKEKPKET